MLANHAELGSFLERLRSSQFTLPSEALLSFAGEVRQLSPDELLDRANELQKTEPRSFVAYIVTNALQSLLGDIDEHGPSAEYADSKSDIRKGLRTWSRIATQDVEPVLLAEDFVAMTVVSAEEHVTKSEKPVWRQLRAAKRLAVTAKAVVKKPLSPWLVEMLAALVASELELLAMQRSGASSKPGDAPALIDALASAVQLSAWPTVYGPRVIGWRAAKLLPDKATKAAVERLVALASPPTPPNPPPGQPSHLALLQAVQKRLDAAGLEKLAKTIHLELGAESHTLQVKGKSLRVTAGKVGEAEITVVADAPSLSALLSGELNPFTAMTTGKVALRPGGPAFTMRNMKLVHLLLPPQT